jgi:hypothetical protein
MVHAVEDAVNPGAHVGGTLGDVGAYEEHAFPELAHRKSAVSSITVLKKALKEKGKIPVCDENDNKDNCHSEKNLKRQQQKPFKKFEPGAMLTEKRETARGPGSCGR